MPRLLRWPLALALACAGPAQAGAFRASAHGDPALLPRACGGCHVGHGPPRTPMLPSAEAAMCLRCHGDSGGRAEVRARGLLTHSEGLGNVAAEFRKASHHPVEILAQTTGLSALTRRTGAPGGPIETLACSSCHDPHYGAKMPTQAQSGLRQVKILRNARGKNLAEYDLCLRCHGSGAFTVAGLRNIASLVRPSSPSFHPVETRGRNPNVPSLVQPYTEQSYTACTDCHGSDQPNGPRGPHGSAFEPILKAHYNRDDGRPATTYEYALCYRCHNQAIVLSGSSFKEHRRHVVDERASCAACHNSHGSEKYAHLIDFDTRVASPNSKGQFRYDALGMGHGSCSLLCHDKDHVQEQY